MENLKEVKTWSIEKKHEYIDERIHKALSDEPDKAVMRRRIDEAMKEQGVNNAK